MTSYVEKIGEAIDNVYGGDFVIEASIKNGVTIEPPESSTCVVLNFEDIDSLVAELQKCKNILLGLEEPDEIEEL
jgi:hypothetical protein